MNFNTEEVILDLQRKYPDRGRAYVKVGEIWYRFILNKLEPIEITMAECITKFDLIKFDQGQEYYFLNKNLHDQTRSIMKFIVAVL